jgi:hypothetical protein
MKVTNVTDLIAPVCFHYSGPNWHLTTLDNLNDNGKVNKQYKHEMLKRDFGRRTLQNILDTVDESVYASTFVNLDLLKVMEARNLKIKGYSSEPVSKELCPICHSQKKTCSDGPKTAYGKTSHEGGVFRIYPYKHGMGSEEIERLWGSLCVAFPEYSFWIPALCKYGCVFIECTLRQGGARYLDVNYRNKKFLNGLKNDKPSPLPFQYPMSYDMTSGLIYLNACMLDVVDRTTGKVEGVDFFEEMGKVSASVDNRRYNYEGTLRPGDYLHTDLYVSFCCWALDKMKRAKGTVKYIHGHNGWTKGEYVGGEFASLLEGNPRTHIPVMNGSVVTPDDIGEICDVEEIDECVCGMAFNKYGYVLPRNGVSYCVALNLNQEARNLDRIDGDELIQTTAKDMHECSLVCPFCDEKFERRNTVGFVEHCNECE